MKCPKCGFVSYAGLEECKKCGYPFVKAAPKGSSSSATALFPEGVRAATRTPAEPLLVPKEISPGAEPELPTQLSPPPVPVPEGHSSTQEEPSAADRPSVDQSSATWREELSDRLVNYRKRRARLQPDVDPTGNLELDFEDSEKPEDIRYVLGPTEAPEERDSGFDLEIGEPAVIHNEQSMLRESPSFEESGDEVMQLDSAPADAEEISIGEPVAKSLPMEILVGPATETAPEERERSEGIFLAPLGHRFLAGLTDALVLILGAGVFGIIVWRVCGRVSLVPFNIVVLGLVAVILIFAYFAVFTAIASATPGLLWMGCEIRSFQGDIRRRKNPSGAPSEFWFRFRRSW